MPRFRDGSARSQAGTLLPASRVPASSPAGGGACDCQLQSLLRRPCAGKQGRRGRGLGLSQREPVSTRSCILRHKAGWVMAFNSGEETVEVRPFPRAGSPSQSSGGCVPSGPAQYLQGCPRLAGQTSLRCVLCGWDAKSEKPPGVPWEDRGQDAKAARFPVGKELAKLGRPAWRQEESEGGSRRPGDTAQLRRCWHGFPEARGAFGQR